MTPTACSRWAAAALAAALIGCTAAEVEFETEAPPRFRVVLIGDSITAGLSSKPKGPSYADLLPERLGPDFEVVNLGCGGTSSLDWTRSRGARRCGGKFTPPNLYLARARPALPADLVTVLLGTNDSHGIGEDHWTSADEYGAALREIAADLLADGAGRVVLLGPPVDPARLGATLRIVRYGEALRAVCDEMPQVVCGPDVLLLLRREDFGARNIHPNGPGHVKIADALAAALLSLTQQWPSQGRPLSLTQELESASSASSTESTSSQR